MRVAGFSFTRMNGRIVHYSLGAHDPEPQGEAQTENEKVRIQGVVSSRAIKDQSVRRG
jgi:hypothetical protein